MKTPLLGMLLLATPLGAYAQIADLRGWVAGTALPSREGR